MRKGKSSWIGVLSLMVVAGITMGEPFVEKASASTARLQNSSPKRPTHVVIVIEENHSDSELAGNPKAPFINRLMKRGAAFTNYHAIEHPSEPNYLDLFSGTNQGVHDDSVPHTFSGPNLASELLNRHFTFAGYSENLPTVGYQGSTDSNFLYARKHNPWVNFTNVPKTDNRPLTQFPTDYNQLPNVSFVIPNLENDMHDGSIATGDAWLAHHLGGYVQWATTHNSLLIVTWDEDDQSESNTVPLVIVGAGVRPGVYRTNLNHFNLLRTLEDMYGLPPLGMTKRTSAILGVWV